MSAPQETWFDHEKLEAYREAIAFNGWLSSLLDEAVRIANDTPYGLAAAVWTRDIYKAFRVVKSLRAGIVWVNHMQPTYVEAPWGGYKQSGFGRELGPWGLEEYLETKQVFVNLDETPIGWY